MSHELTPEELESTGGEPLPDREAMSILPISPDLTLPIETPTAGGSEELPVEDPAALKGPAD